MRIMDTPRSVDIDITNRCNLRCTYCYHFSGPGDVKTDLPTEQWLDFFKTLGRLAVMHVVFSGGEPFIRKDIKTLVTGIVENKMRFSFLSNGTLISDDAARFLSATQRCDGVQVSIDGASPETHDVFRGKGSFQKAIKGIQCLLNNHVPVDVRVTIHKHNISELKEIARFLLEEMNLPGFSTNVASYLGQCRQHMDEVRLSIEERMQAMDDLLSLNKIYPNRITANAGPLAEARMWQDMMSAYAGTKGLSHEGGRLTGCGCVLSKIAVRADGTIVPCTMLSHIALGRINQDDVHDIWKNHTELKRLRERRHISLSEFQFCQGCDYLPFCTGNCPGLAYTLTGEVNHPSPDACLKRFIEDGGRLSTAA